MTRRSGSKGRAVPKYRLHKTSGKAVVTINGKETYLGKYDSPGSHQRYKQLLADLWHPPGALPKPKLVKPDQVTVSDLAIEFGTHAKQKYGSDSNEWRQIQNVLKLFRETYGHLSPSEFGPKRFEDFRQQFAGLSRAVIKRKSNYVLKMFQHCVKFELIPVELWQRLLSVGPVDFKCKPPKKVKPVDELLVKATQQELTPILSDMVEVHQLIGARPSEVCNMRPCVIDRTKAVWVYRPATHKTENHGHSREISVGPKAQAVLAPYLLRGDQEYCFTPSEAFDQHCRLRNENRKTPKSCGNVPRSRKPKSFQPNYNKDSYRRAIERAVLRAFPMPKNVKANKEKAAKWKAKYVWKPNQLRHSAATNARREFDLETAQIVLGHSSKATTEKFYAEIDNDRAIEFARKFG